MAAFGLLVALIANQLSPRGLSFTRNYFPASAPADRLTQPQASPPPTGGTNATEATPASEVVARLQARGLRRGSHQDVARLFQDPGYETERIVFVDARKDDRYTEGHIPGAYQLDHYYPLNHLPDLLPVCQLADTVVVYCTGGNCEDSEFAALLLKESGVPAEKLLVYAGGLEEWRSQGLPVEMGARHSGDLRIADR